MKLNLGCGKDYREGWVNLDIDRNVKADVYHDADIFPYPFEDNYFNEVDLQTTFEHFMYPKKVLKELVRICKKGAVIKILTSYYNHYDDYSNIEHCHSFNDRAFTNNLNIPELKVIKIECIKGKMGIIIPFAKFLSRYIGGLIKQIYVELEVIKRKHL